MMSEVCKVTVEADGVAWIAIDSPPVNALGLAVRRAIVEALAALQADAAVRAVVLACAGRTFFAGADIAEFGKPRQAPTLPHVLDAIEASSKPVIAAIHGSALGGGYELALVCHYRIAVPSAKVGLPEVKLGILPGGGGTQRLPRLVGVDAALDIITGGAPVAAPRALDLGMIDALAAEGRLREDALAFARDLLAKAAPLVRVRDREDRIAPARGHPEIFADYLARNARAFRGLDAPHSIVRAVQAAVDSADFDAGMARERALFLELEAGPQSAALRHVFFAERETGRIPDLAPDLPRLPVTRVGVIGAGTMGGGIAMNFLNIGLPVVLVDLDAAALDRGLAVIRRNYEVSAKKGRLTRDEVEARMALIAPATTLDALGEVDLVIEAVFEDMAVKQQVFTRLDEVTRADAILASNTSFLDLDAIAAVVARPERVVGLHFFSPANVMRLLEVVRGARTAPAVIATAMALARTIGKVPVLSGVCHGFIANRIMSRRAAQAEHLVLQGPTPQDIDGALRDYGFAMGPFEMIDLVGLDVIGRGGTERTLRGDLVALDRLGQKRNGGFYDYDADRRASPSPVAAQAIADFAAFKGVAPLGPVDRAEIVARLLYPVVNEGARVLQEGIALRAGDIDMAAILGYNWPAATGGPMFWADRVGLPAIVEALHRFGIEPAPLLADYAAAGRGFAFA
jgi:3-hydroxyacyl-CoA dehydrogenase